MAQTRRAQILMEPDEYDQLARLAEQRDVSVAELTRSAVRRQHLQSSTEDRVAAVHRIAAMAGPTSSWSDMKRDIEDALDSLLP